MRAAPMWASPVGWTAAPQGEESPGSMEIRRRITSGGGDPRESATESKPPVHGRARVKGCGKSAPRTRRRGRHGKPRREQNRIGMTRSRQETGLASGLSPGRRPGWLLEAFGNERPRGMAVTRRSIGPAPYRTRLTGRLAIFCPERGVRALPGGAVRLWRFADRSAKLTYAVVYGAHRPRWSCR